MKRPIGIVILSLIQAFVGLVLVLGGISLLLGTNSEATRQALNMANLSSDTGTLVSYGVVILILAAVELLIAIGLFQLKGWAWGLSIIIFGANVVMVVVDLINHQSITQSQEVGGLIGLLVVIYLLLPGVRGAFFSRSPAHAA